MWHRCSLPYMLTALLHGTKSLQVCRFQPEHSMLQDYQSCLPEYKLTTIELSVQCSVLKHRHCRVLLCVVNTASCALCRMSTDSIFNIASCLRQSQLESCSYSQSTWGYSKHSNNKVAVDLKATNTHVGPIWPRLSVRPRCVICTEPSGRMGSINHCTLS